jgi:hypothetical protein
VRKEGVEEEGRKRSEKMKGELTISANICKNGKVQVY